MASSINKVQILGQLGADPELKTLTGGHKVVRFNVATNHSFQSGEETKVRTEWHRIIAWNKLAEICEKHLAKGNRVLVEGSLQTREWQDQNNQKRYTTEIKANEVHFITSTKNHAPGNDGPEEMPF